MRYFSQVDFAGANPQCDMSDMDKKTLRMFDRARHIAGIPFIVNSAYRTIEHEVAAGRDGSSSHTSGKAMDIRATTSRQRYLIITALLRAGFNRIGVHARFIHADMDNLKDRDVIWMY